MFARVAAAVAQVVVKTDGPMLDAAGTLLIVLVVKTLKLVILWEHSIFTAST